MIVANFFFAKWTARIEKFVLEKKDNRMNIISEIMANIKIIKLNSWVKYFIDKVSFQRNKELRFIKKRLSVNVVGIYINWMLSPTMLVLSFSTYFL
mmetsp:Transcript_42719/g.50022  ORF Transcript_42719/g.50022 Transcript_42719/m.50022 type:complete len:96 (+) Transcript_42719:808-1095(+)